MRQHNKNTRFEWENGKKKEFTSTILQSAARLPKMRLFDLIFRDLLQVLDPRLE